MKNTTKMRKVEVVAALKEQRAVNENLVKENTALVAKLEGFTDQQAQIKVLQNKSKEVQRLNTKTGVEIRTTIAAKDRYIYTLESTNQEKTRVLNKLEGRVKTFAEMSRIARFRSSAVIKTFFRTGSF